MKIYVHIEQEKRNYQLQFLKQFHLHYKFKFIKYKVGLIF